MSVAVGDLKSAADRSFARRRLVGFALPGLALLYLAYVFFAFDVPGLAERARLDNAMTLVSDAWSHKTHVTRETGGDRLEIAIEGERKGTYPAGMVPDWMTVTDERTVIDLGGGEIVTLLPDDAVTVELPDYGTLGARVADGTVALTLPGEVPGWINASDTRATITTGEGRVTVTRSKIEVFRYSGGWELFWFTLESPYHGRSLPTLLFGEQVDPARTNLSGMAQDFWRNAMWRHADVAWALGETLLMAFLGTMGAAIAALPLAFLAARNFAPLMAVRFAVRRCLDFVRGVDALIWTIMLSRAFGPGPLTGTLAILVTDTGTFGKIFSEALENVDDRQIEGVRSTGAGALQRYRFGVIPQIVPVLASQILYFLESNTRSATIIGAITGGGIGLLLTQAMQTQKDWEEVSYYIVLIILMVFAMDAVSGWLRRKLIKGE